MPELKGPNRMGFKFNSSGGFESTNFLQGGRVFYLSFTSLWSC